MLPSGSHQGGTHNRLTGFRAARLYEGWQAIRHRRSHTAEHLGERDQLRLWLGVARRSRHVLAPIKPKMTSNHDDATEFFVPKVR
jgi:hypothetical protein